MSLPTWRDLYQHHCTSRKITKNNTTQDNPYHEDMAMRRYNYSTATDVKCCRLVFLKNVLDNPENKTLVRKGRFIWCKELKYEGRDDKGMRQISFSIDKGHKRFRVSENNFLCVQQKHLLITISFSDHERKLSLPSPQSLHIKILST